METRSEVLNRYLSINHDHYAMLVHGVLHSHLAHILGSVYLLGGSSEHLEEVFSVVSADLESWKPPHVSINSDEDLYTHLGDQEYQRAFLDFFDRRLKDDFYGDWRKFSLHYLVNSDRPLLNGTVGGFGHPLIHFADAFELQSPQLAVEALALTAVDYNPLHMVLDGLAKAPASPTPSSALEILHRISADPRFDGLLQKAGVGNTMAVLKSPEARSAIVDYVRSFDLSTGTLEEAMAKVQELTKVAVLLLTATYDPEIAEGHAFDFYLTHQLTFCWCLYILIPALPADAAPSLLREVWLLMVLTYVTELRPSIVQERRIVQEKLASNSPSSEWKRLTDVALNAAKGQGMDPHYVKVIRTLLEFAKIWPMDEALFLNACIAFERDFVGWAALD